MSHCQVCGTLLEDRELEHEGIIPFCPRCGEFRFPMYNVAVSMIVINKENRKTLLVKQYGKDFYRLVAGYVNRTEPLEHAVVRELKEETGMTAVRPDPVQPDAVFRAVQYADVQFHRLREG